MDAGLKNRVHWPRCDRDLTGLFRDKCTECGSGTGEAKLATYAVHWESRRSLAVRSHAIGVVINFALGFAALVSGIGLNTRELILVGVLLMMLTVVLLGLFFSARSGTT